MDAYSTLEQKLLFSRNAAAQALDISLSMIDRAIAAGALETRRVNSKILIPVESLRTFAASDHALPRSDTREGISA